MFVKFIKLHMLLYVELLILLHSYYNSRGIHLVFGFLAMKSD